MRIIIRIIHRKVAEERFQKFKQAEERFHIKHT